VLVLFKGVSKRGGLKILSLVINDLGVLKTDVFDTLMMDVFR